MQKLLALTNGEVADGSNLKLWKRREGKGSTGVQGRRQDGGVQLGQFALSPLYVIGAPSCYVIKTSKYSNSLRTVTLIHAKIRKAFSR